MVTSAGSSAGALYDYAVEVLFCMDRCRNYFYAVLCYIFKLVVQGNQEALCLNIVNRLCAADNLASDVWNRSFLLWA